MRKINKSFLKWCEENNKLSLLEEWDYESNKDITPDNISYSSRKLVNFKCNKGHTYHSSMANKTKLSKCPICSNKKLLVGYNDLASRYQELLKEWDYIKNEVKPSEIVYGSDMKVWWKCSKGHEWSTRVRNRTIYKTNCPICSRKNSINLNLLESYPELLKEWDYDLNKDIDPLNISSKTIKYWWKCDKGHEFSSSINSRIKGKICPICEKEKNTISFSDKYPLYMKEWDFDKNDINPYESLPLSHDIVYWKCKLGHSWKTPLYLRLRGTKCPICLNKVVEPGFNDLGTIRSDVAKEWDYSKNKDLLPSNVLSGSRMKVWWKCEFGHSYFASIVNRTKYNSKCPICNKSRKKNK